MIPRLGLDLEPGAQIARFVPGTDLLDIAYGAAHGGGEMILLPVSLLVTSLYTPDLFDRPGLPLLVVKVTIDELDRVPSLGPAPDRLLVTGRQGEALEDFGAIADLASRLAASHQELAVLIEPEVPALKEMSRRRAQWAFFSTERAYRCASLDELAVEMARMSSAAAAAHSLKLRTALLGRTGRQLPRSLAQLPHIEEMYPSPDLWALALRLGWEKAFAEYRGLML